MRQILQAHPAPDLIRGLSLREKRSRLGGRDGECVRVDQSKEPLV